MLAGILAGVGGHLGCQQVHDWAVFIGRPHGAVETEKTCSSTFLSAETNRAVVEPRRKPLEAHRNFRELAAEFVHDTVDHAAADQRLANHNFRGPAIAMGE